MTLRGAFDVDSTSAIASLAPRKTAVFEVSVRPQREQYGPAVPLELIVTYADMHGGVDSVRRRIPIRVLQHGAAPDTITPLEIDIQSDRFNRNIERPGIPNVNQEDIDQQQKLLAIHRRNLALYLEQQAKLGAAFIPPSLSNGIFEARENIQRIKQALRDWGVVVADHPDDGPDTNSD